MNRKIMIKRAIDLLMTIGLLILMGYQFWGDFFHEWTGVTMFVLFIAHHILNAGWYRGLPRGSHSPARILQIVIDFLLLAAMLGMMISGIILSRHALAFLPISGGASLGRLLHMASVYWGFVLMALHLGLHWNMVLAMADRSVGKSKRHGLVRVVIGTAVAAYGLWVFFSRRLLDYMLLRTQFVFLDFGESKLLFYVEYLAMMGLFIYLAHYGTKLLKRSALRKGERNEAS